MQINCLQRDENALKRNHEEAKTSNQYADFLLRPQKKLGMEIAI